MLAGHPNIVAVRGSFVDGGARVRVQDVAAVDLAALLDARLHILPLPAVRALMRALLAGLAHAHDCGVMHRDVKPANLLLTAGGVLQVGDWGLGRPFARRGDDGAPDDGHEYTNQVSSRWYRAPEVLFGARSYGPAVDVWAAGAVFAELLNGAPLAAGGSDIEQLARVLALRGTPTPDTWPGAHLLPDYDKITFAPTPAPPVSSLAPRACAAGLHLLDGLLTLDPRTRVSARHALAHPYFTEGDAPGAPPHKRCATAAELAAIVADVVAGRAGGAGGGREGDTGHMN